MGANMATQVAVGTELNEAKLIRAGQRGDSQAVEALFRRYQRPLFQTALRVLGNAEDAEDALQDGLLSAYRNLTRFEGRSQFSDRISPLPAPAVPNRASRVGKCGRCRGCVAGRTALGVPQLETVRGALAILRSDFAATSARCSKPRFACWEMRKMPRMRCRTDCSRRTAT